MNTVLRLALGIWFSVSLAVVFLAAGPGTAWGLPINVSATLTGDPRTANPDNLNVDVTIISDTTQSTASWTVDLDMAASHPSVKLGGFFFNMDTSLGQTYSLGSFSPNGWGSISGTAPGSGNMSFDFGVGDPPGSPTAVDVTNSQDLTFVLTKLTGGNFVAADFTNAGSSCSNDVSLGCGQLGAHLQSLSTTTGDGTTDSGFALGNYLNNPVPPEQEPIPEPGTLLLLGSGLAGLGGTAFARRRRGAR